MTGSATNAVIRVGDGRGLIVKDADQVRRVVITAAHCLPFFPPCHAAAYLHERTYDALLGPLGQKSLPVWAECLFVDPISDIAVLGEPDDQELPEQWSAYEALVSAAKPLRITDAPKKTSGRLLSVDGRWFSCQVNHMGGPLWISDAVEGIVGGMSGSPILADNGSAIGAVSVSAGKPNEVHTEGGPNPRLAYHLPARFLPRFR